MKIGVIDSQSDRRHRLEALLRETGHRIETVSLEPAESVPDGAGGPEVLLVDWEQLAPHTCRHLDALRKRYRLSGPMIVAMLQPGDDPVEALRCGADEVLPPGFDRDQVRLVLVLAERQLQRRKFDTPRQPGDRSLEWTWERLAKINRLQCRLLGYGSLDDKLGMIAESMVDTFLAEYCRIWLVYPGDRCNSDCPHGRDLQDHPVCRSRGMCLHLVASSDDEHAAQDHCRVPMDCDELAGVLQGRHSSAHVTAQRCRQCLSHELDEPDPASVVCYRVYDATGDAVGVMVLGLDHEVSAEEDMLIDTVCKSTSQVLRAGLAEQAVSMHAADVDRANTELHQTRREMEELTRTLEDQLARNSMDIKQLLEQKEQLIRRLGHDLNSPLTPLVALLPLALRKVEDPKVRDILERSIRSVEVIRDLVAKTLRMADVTRLDLKMEFDEVPLRQVVQASLERWGDMLRGKSVSVDVDIDDSVSVAGYDVFLQEMVDNLVSNAARYVEQDGHVRVSAVRKQDVVELAVVDDGCGLTETQLGQVFDEFYKADKSRHDHKTSGLGLSICRQVARLHHGSIWAESDGPGHGCRFVVTLKAWADAQERAA